MAKKINENIPISVRLSDTELKEIDDIIADEGYLTRTRIVKESVANYINQRNGTEDTKTAKAIKDLSDALVENINEQTESYNNTSEAYMATQIMLKETMDKVDYFCSLIADEMNFPEVIEDDEELFKSYEKDLDDLDGEEKWDL